MKREFFVNASAVLAAVIVFVGGLTLVGVNPVNGFSSAKVIETSTKSTFKNLEVKSSNPNFNPAVGEIVIKYDNDDKVEDIIVDGVSLLHDEPSLGKIIQTSIIFYHNRNNFKIGSIRDISTDTFEGYILSTVERDENKLYVSQLININGEIAEEIEISSIE